MSKFKLNFSLEEGMPEVVIDSHLASDSEEQDDSMFYYEGYAKSIISAQESMITLVNISNVLIATEDISVEALELAERTIDFHRKNSQLVKIQRYSLESMSYSKRKSIAIETASETIRNIWNKIVETFKFIIEKIKSFFKSQDIKREKSEAVKKYNDLKQESSSKEGKIKKPVRVNRYLNFIKSIHENQELTVKDIKYIIDNVDSGLVMLSELLSTVESDLDVSKNSMLTDILDNLNNHSMPFAGDRAIEVFSHFFKTSKFIKFIDDYRETIPHELKATIAKDNNLDINNFKVLLDLHSNKFLSALTVKLNEQYAEENTYTYLVKQLESQSMYGYSSVENLSTHDKTVIYSLCIDTIDRRISIFDRLTRNIDDLEKNIDLVQTAIDTSGNYTIAVQAFVIPFVNNFSRVLTSVITSCSDINLRVKTIMRFIDSLESVDA